MKSTEGAHTRSGGFPQQRLHTSRPSTMLLVTVHAQDTAPLEQYNAAFPSATLCPKRTALHRRSSALIKYSPPSKASTSGLTNFFWLRRLTSTTPFQPLSDLLLSTSLLCWTLGTPPQEDSDVDCNVGGSVGSSAHPPHFFLLYFRTTCNSHCQRPSSTLLLLPGHPSPTKEHIMMNRWRPSNVSMSVISANDGNVRDTGRRASRGHILVRQRRWRC